MSVLVGKSAPDFTAAAVMGNNQIDESFNLHAHIKGKHAVIFFYPLDFTFVCPTELIAFDHRLNEFKARNVEVIGVSIDSHFTHL
ncbi:MAG TPA: redoxin domain-containing protein, partial [Burkholderiales bacterium]|nr:redoxin domain-containing protein [Burkholderiales bacterium]